MVRNLAHSEVNILATAKRHFLAYGFAGARMQPIADEAGVNKALLHYYYKNKEGLFKKVFEEESEKMLASAEEIAQKKIPILEKLTLLVENDIEHLLKNPDMPMFMMREMARDPALMKKFDPTKRGEKVLSSVFQEILVAQKKGIIKKEIDPRDIFINMASLAMFPFIAKSFCMIGGHMTEKEYTSWLTKRERSVAEFITEAIKK
jgi:AcrR family transcriptional regulator